MSPANTHHSILRQRILVAEDHPVCALVLQDQLASLGPFDVEVCASGAGAWHAWQREPPALLITDLYLPGMDGMTLVRAIRAAERAAGTEACPRTAIVLVTATLTPTLRDHCGQAGVDALLQKPVSLDELSSLVDRHLQAAG